LVNTAVIFTIGLLIPVSLTVKILIEHLSLKNATKRIHEEMVGRILKAPITTYFDVNPIG
jgi:hypothetical protein